MPPTTDRGFACLHREPNGTTTVTVCASRGIAKPRDGYARHVGLTDDRLRVEPGVSLSTGAYRWTSRIVEVFSSADGVVHIGLPPATPL